MNFWNIPEIGKDGNDVGRVSGPNQWEKVCAFLNPTFYLFFFSFLLFRVIISDGAIEMSEANQQWMPMGKNKRFGCWPMDWISVEQWRCRLAALQLFALLLCRESLRKAEILEFGFFFQMRNQTPFGPKWTWVGTCHLSGCQGAVEF